MLVSRRQAIKILGGSAAAGLIGGGPAFGQPTPTPTASTGLPSGITISNMEWPLWFCNVKKNPTAPYFVWDDPSVVPNVGGAKKGAGITIVHPDVGYTLHPEIMQGGRVDVDRAKNFLNEGDPPFDPLTGPFPSHGTSTASVLMSEIGHPNIPPDPNFSSYTVPPHLFVSGIAPTARIIPCRVSHSVLVTGDSTTALTKAIYYAIDLSITDGTIGVMSISLGCPLGSVALAAAIYVARSHGIVICAAAGQLPTQEIRDAHPWLPQWVQPGKLLTPRYPGNDKNVICVAACGSDHNMLDVGFYGPAVDITAPGVNIFRAESVLENPENPPGDRVESSTGSSYATPIVAGACALWQAHHGRQWLIATYGSALIFDLFLWTLSQTCDTRGGTWDTAKHGMGVVNVEALLKKAPISKSDLLAWIDNH